MQVAYYWRFSTNISLHRVLSTMRPSGVINTVPPNRGELVTLIGGVCVMCRGLHHSSEARVTALLTSVNSNDLK